MVVLPLPLGPVSTVVPSGAGSTTMAVKQRKSVSATECSTARRSSDLRTPVPASTGSGSRLVPRLGRLDDHLVVQYCLDAVDQIRRVERNEQVFSREIAIDGLVCLA